MIVGPGDGDGKGARVGAWMGTWVGGKEWVGAGLGPRAHWAHVGAAGHSQNSDAVPTYVLDDLVEVVVVSMSK